MRLILSDLRHVFRGLWRHPGFTAIAVLILALGIGANSAIFSVVRGVLLTPLPYGDPGQLVSLWNQFPEAGEDMMGLSHAELTDWRQHDDLFAGVASLTTGEQNFVWTLETDDGRTEKHSGAFVTANLFDVLAVNAVLGRTFLPEEETEGHNLVVVMSNAFWRTRFNGDPSIVGRTLRIAGEERTVVGIMPPGFHTSLNVTGAGPVDFWVAMVVDPNSPRMFRGLNAVARLQPSVALRQGQAQADVIAREMALEYPEAYPEGPGFQFALDPLHGRITGDVRTPLFVLLGTVAVILLIALANVASLLLVRAESRQQEVAVRTALGAALHRVVRPFVLEGLVLAGGGAVLGLFVAYGGVALLRVFNPGNIPLMDTVMVDPGVIAFTTIIALLTGIGIGLVPGIHAAGADTIQAIRDGTRSATAGRGRHRVRRLLVVSEMALAVLLVIGAGLLIKSFRHLTAIDLGIQPERVLTMRMEFPRWQYPEIEDVRATHTAILDRVENVAGVWAVSIAHAEHPLRLNGRWTFTVVGRPVDPDQVQPLVGIRVVSAQHLETLGVPLLRGRFFDQTDRVGAPFAIVINEAMAREWFPDEDPIGARLKGGAPIPDDIILEIVGVIGDVKNEGIREAVRPTMLFPYTNAAFATGWQRFMTLMVRSSATPTTLAADVRRAIREVDGQLTVSQIQTLEEVVSGTVAVPRFVTAVLGGFALLALVLAALGIYGVISYTVTQRTREIGVRIALGADRNNILRLVMRGGVVLAAVGIGVGVVLALGITRLLTGLLFEISSSDPSTYLSVGLVLGLVALAASYLPARRASSVDPIHALHHD